MSLIPFPETLDSSADLQIWNNAAFDKSGEIADYPTAGRQSWGSLKSIFENPNSSFDSDAGKENDYRLATENGVRASPVSSSLKPSIACDKSRTEGISEKKLDEEIADVERQISRLNSRLEALKLERSRKSVKPVDRGGRSVRSKFMDSIPKSQKRGISLGPAEIMSGGRRRGAMSMGPSEIFGAVKSKQQTITPVQNRRTSCLWKLEDIDEKKAVTVMKEQGKRFSVSPNSRKAVTTVASKKLFPIIHSVQPKKLFGEGEKSAPPASSNKSSLRLSGRVVASRYNQSSGQVPEAMRKRSLPEGGDVRVKKRWDIPGVETGEARLIVDGRDLLPRIKVARSMRESPRDSGPAKRVVELIGRKSFFCNEDSEVEPSVCQALAFAEEDEGVEFSFPTQH